MLKIYTGITPLKVKTDNLETIPSAVCDDLSLGDVVVHANDDEEKTYVVSIKVEKDELYLTHTDGAIVEEVLYKYSEENGWEYENQTSTTLGGMKLYKHVVKYQNEEATIVITSTSDTQITSQQELQSKIKSSLSTYTSYRGQLTPIIDALDTSARGFVLIGLNAYLTDGNVSFHIDDTYNGGTIESDTITEP